MPHVNPGAAAREARLLMPLFGVYGEYRSEPLSIFFLEYESFPGERKKRSMSIHFSNKFFYCKLSPTRELGIYVGTVFIHSRLSEDMFVSAL